MKRIIIILVLISSFLFAQEGKEDYMIMVEKDFSPYTGSENILFVHEGVEYIFNWAFSNKKEKKFISILARLGAMIFIYNPLTDLELVLQHEVFGHGYRIRDIGSDKIRVKEYEIDAPMPYGDGGGSTVFTFNDKLTSFEQTAISAAGVEASAILANRLKMKWFTTLKLDPKKAWLYFLAEHDLTAYVLSLNDSAIFVNEGHDIQGYLDWLNNTYFTDRVSISDVTKAVLINFVDPISYYALGAYFYYIFTGKDLNIWTINIKNLKFLPNLRLGLAPYGLEYYLENFMSYKNSPIYTYFRAGHHFDNTYWGLGLEYQKILNFNNNFLGFRFDFYRQPKIYSKEGITTWENVQVGYSQSDLNKMIIGSSFYLIFDKNFSKKHDLFFHIELGYKTDGFIQGQSLKSSPIFRLGLNLGHF